MKPAAVARGRGASVVLRTLEQGAEHTRGGPALEWGPGDPPQLPQTPGAAGLSPGNEMQRPKPMQARCVLKVRIPGCFVVVAVVIDFWVLFVCFSFWLGMFRALQDSLVCRQEEEIC